VSSVSNGLYFPTLPLVSVMHVIKRNIEKVRGARYTLGARYLPKNTVFIPSFDIMYTLRREAVCVSRHW
jgi:hypothetical protein